MRKNNSNYDVFEVDGCKVINMELENKDFLGIYVRINGVRFILLNAGLNDHDREEVLNCGINHSELESEVNCCFLKNPSTDTVKTVCM